MQKTIYSKTFELKKKEIIPLKNTEGLSLPTIRIALVHLCIPVCRSINQHF